MLLVSCHGLNVHRYYKVYSALLPVCMMAKATVATWSYCFIASRVSLRPCSQIISIRWVNYNLFWPFCLNIVVKKHLIKLCVYLNFFWSLCLNIVIKTFPSYACCLLHAGFLLGLLFNPEDGGDMFLWNVSWLLRDCTALCLRRQNSSECCFQFY
jgi:hypothetical protein